MNNMNKTIISILACCLFLSCSPPQNNSNSTLLDSEIKILQEQIQKSYKPRLCNFMLSFQVHHEKLWHAGKNTNWKLAEFELQKLNENLEDVRTYLSELPEVNTISMLPPAIDSVNDAIRKKDFKIFKSSFNLLTNTCNNCHRANNKEFNVITVPESSTFANQSFEVLK